MNTTKIEKKLRAYQVCEDERPLYAFPPDAQAEIAKLDKRIAELEERRCEICGYAEHHREHTGCLRVFVDEQSAEIVRLKAVIEKCENALEHCGQGRCSDDMDDDTFCNVELVEETLAAIKKEGL